jgi:hypothetical protein
LAAAILGKDKACPLLHRECGVFAERVPVYKPRLVYRVGDTATDIDAAILDRTTGELALFQLKWQDYFTNDVRKLRSKASNLANELDNWADEVAQWTHHQTSAQILTTLRIRQNAKTEISKVHMFAISRINAKSHGYGFGVNHSDLAVCNWPQFCRTRFENGPAKSVFGELHKKLRNEMNSKPTTIPIPAEFVIDGTTFHFEDLWSSVTGEAR